MKLRAKRFFPPRLNQLLITWFGCGYAPIAPGTAGSLGALPLCWGLALTGDFPLRLACAVGMTAIAILGAAQDQFAHSERRDPQYIVVDEVAGMLWSTLFLPASWKWMAAGFVLFRIFDALKPFPVSFVDRSSKKAKGPFQRGALIVLDDVLAGWIVFVILKIASWHWAC